MLLHMVTLMPFSSSKNNATEIYLNHILGCFPRPLNHQYINKAPTHTSSNKLSIKCLCGLCVGGGVAHFIGWPPLLCLISTIPVCLDAGS